MLSLAGIWGASFLFMRIIAPVLGSIPTAFFRVSIAATGLLVMLVLMRVSWNFGGKLKVVLILGVINSGLPATLYSVAAQVLPAGYSAIFNATTPKRSAMYIFQKAKFMMALFKQLFKSNSSQASIM